MRGTGRHGWRPAWAALAAATVLAAAGAAQAQVSTPNETLLLGPAPLLAFKDQGPSVQVLQQDLLALGYHQVGQPSGVFDANTWVGLVLFQRHANLDPSGTTTTETWRSMETALGSRPLGSVTLGAWDRGLAVRVLQGDLWQFGFDPGPVDGVLGPETTAALQKFQAHEGVPVTGQVDGPTYAAIVSQFTTPAPQPVTTDAAAPGQPAPQSAPAKAASTASTPTIDGHPVVGHLSVIATAYGPSAADNYPFGPVDAFGAPLKPGMVAVDPRVIPLHTWLWVSGYSSPYLPAGGFLAQALDTGGAIKGNRVDIYLDRTPAQVSSFGIQKVSVTVLGN